MAIDQVFRDDERAWGFATVIRRLAERVLDKTHRNERSSVSTDAPRAQVEIGVLDHMNIVVHEATPPAPVRGRLSRRSWDANSPA